MPHLICDHRHVRYLYWVSSFERTRRQAIKFEALVTTGRRRIRADATTSSSERCSVVSVLAIPLLLVPRALDVRSSEVTSITGPLFCWDDLEPTIRSMQR